MTNFEIIHGNYKFKKLKVDGRYLPRRCAELYTLASKNKLKNPLGRALYAVNRLQNGWRSVVVPVEKGSVYPYRLQDPLDLMKKAKDSTAYFWRHHWADGGSIRAHRSQKEQLKFNRLRRKEAQDRIDAQNHKIGGM